MRRPRSAELPAKCRPMPRRTYIFSTLYLQRGAEKMSDAEDFFAVPRAMRVGALQLGRMTTGPMQNTINTICRGRRVRVRTMPLRWAVLRDTP